MSVIQDYYDSDFEYGTPAIAAYWGALTGYRMEMNKKKLSMQIRQMDPSVRQKQLSLIQDQIIKLRELRQNMLQSDQEARMTMWQEYQETTRKQAELESEANKIAAQVDAERDVARMRYAERQFGERVLPANISRKIAQGPQNDASWVELQNEVMQSLAGSADNPRRTNALQDAVVNQELITAAGTAGQPGFNSSQKLLFKNWTGIDPSNPRGTMTRAQYKELKDGGFLYPEGHAKQGQIMDPQRASTWWFNRNYAAYTPSELERQFGGGMRRPDQIQNVDSRGFYSGPPNTDTIDRQIRALEIQAGRLRDRAVIDDAKYDQLVTNFGGMNLALSPVALRPSALRYPTQRIIDLYDADPERAREVFTQLGSQEEAAETSSIWQKARRAVGLGPEMPEIETQLYDESLVAGEDPLDAAVRFELEAAGMDARLADMPDWASGVQRGRVAEFRAKAARMQEEDPEAFARRYPKARTAVASGDPVANQDLVSTLLFDQINPMMNAGMVGDDIAALDTAEGAIEFYRRLGIQTDADGDPIGISEEEAEAKADGAIAQQVDQWESGARALESWIENAESNLVQNRGLVDQELLTEAKQALQNYKEVAWNSAIEEYGGEDYGAAAEGSETYDAIYEQYGGNPGKILQEIGQKIQSSFQTEGWSGFSAQDKATLRKTQSPRGMLLDQLGAVKDKIDANENPIEQAETLYQTVQDLGEGAGSIGQEIMAEIDRAKDPETFNRALFEHRVDELYNLLQGETAPTEIEDDVPDDDEPQELFIEDEPVDEEKEEDPPFVPDTPTVGPGATSEEIWGVVEPPKPEPKPNIPEQAPPTHQSVNIPQPQAAVPDPVPNVVDTPDVDDQVDDPDEGGGGRRRPRFGLKGKINLFPRGGGRSRGEGGRPRRGERSEGTLGAVPKINRTQPNAGEYERAGQWDTVDRIGRYKDAIRWNVNKDDPDLAGLGQNAGTLYRYYYEPSRGRPVLYRMDYVEPRGRYATIPFSLDRAVKVERGSEEYQTAISEIESAFEIEE